MCHTCTQLSPFPPACIYTPAPSCSSPSPFSTFWKLYSPHALTIFEHWLTPHLNPSGTFALSTPSCGSLWIYPEQTWLCLSAWILFADRRPWCSTLSLWYSLGWHLPVIGQPLLMTPRIIAWLFCTSAFNIKQYSKSDLKSTPCMSLIISNALLQCNFSCPIFTGNQFCWAPRGNPSTL